MREIFSSMRRTQLFNLIAVTSVLAMILVMFAIQFGVENMQDSLGKTESDIASYEDEMRLLEVEWVYLTRPERLRNLASLYLKTTGYTLASQIKKTDQLAGYYLASYRKSNAEASEERVSF